MRKSVASGEVVSDLGSKADALFADAAEKFAAGTPAGEADVMALYKAKAEELRAALSTALEPVYVAQIALLKDGALSWLSAPFSQPSLPLGHPPDLCGICCPRQMRWRATSAAC